MTIKELMRFCRDTEDCDKCKFKSSLCHEADELLSEYDTCMPLIYVDDYEVIREVKDIVIGKVNR